MDAGASPTLPRRGSLIGALIVRLTSKSEGYLTSVDKNRFGAFSFGLEPPSATKSWWTPLEEAGDRPVSPTFPRTSGVATPG